MTRTPFLLTILLTCLFSACSKYDAPPPGAVKPGEASAGETQLASPALSAEVFDSGKMKMSEPSDLAMEDFLEDLRARRNYDLSQHNNHPGPDAPYLNQWVEKATAELLNCGYTQDPEGHFHRPNNGPLVDFQ